MSPKSLEFDLNSSVFPMSMSAFLSDLSIITDASEKLTKLDDYIRELESELRKIDAFKRELAFCMLIMNEAVDNLKKERLRFYREMEAMPLTSELLSLKVGGNSNEDTGAKKSNKSEMKQWMSSAQLWTTGVQHENLHKRKQQESALNLIPGSEEEDGPSYENPYEMISRKFKKMEGFVGPLIQTQSDIPIKKNNSTSINSGETGVSFSVPEGAAKELHINLLMNWNGNTSAGAATTSSGPSGSPEPSKKPRRCWSTDLHRRFVCALEQLGGPNVATPKQIRQMMQVGDLTNDEVKSHLQKYRLHTRRMPADPCFVGASNYWGVDPSGNGNQSTKGKSNSQYSGSPESHLLMNRSPRGVSTSTTATATSSGHKVDDENSEGRN